ncbi:hypothetical protein [Micromonospora sp. NPDC048898]|uniref:hypothetical protein n=1 Tax=Micromonospora sp. NPDC048898 TaxID=3364260 RepID=UPI003720DB84
MSSQIYRVRVIGEGDKWLADVDGLPEAHTFADNLSALDGAVREVIALVEDLPEGAEDELELVYDLELSGADLDDAMERLRLEQRRVWHQAEALEQHLTVLRRAVHTTEAHRQGRDAA